MDRYVDAANKLKEENSEWSYQELCQVLDLAYVDTETDIV